MPYFKHAGGQTYYEVHGSVGDHIVFAHSMLFNLRMFDDQVDFFKDNYQCISYDFKGQGLSSIEYDGYDLNTLMEETAKLIIELDFAPCHFVGFSMGGMIAMKLASKYPHLIKSLILIDTTASPEPENRKTRNKAMLWIAKYFGLNVLANRIMNMFFAKSFLNDPRRSEKKNYWKKQFKNNDKFGVYKAASSVLNRTGFYEELDNISCPTLILVGSEDTLAPVEKAERLQSSISGSTLTIIPHAGHMSTVEEPEFVNKTIASFLTNLDSV